MLSTNRKQCRQSSRARIVTFFPDKFFWLYLSLDMQSLEQQRHLECALNGVQFFN